MKIHITIDEPVILTDTFGKIIKGPMKSLGPFETFNSAIKWLEFLKTKHEEDREVFMNELQSSSRSKA